MSCSYCDQVCESDACIECRNAVRSIHDGISGLFDLVRGPSNQQKVRVTYIVQTSRSGGAPFSVVQIAKELEISPVVQGMMMEMMEMGEDNNDDPMGMDDDNFREASRKGLALNPAFQKFYDWEISDLEILPGEAIAPVTKKYIAVDAVLL